MCVTYFVRNGAVEEGRDRNIIHILEYLLSFSLPPFFSKGPTSTLRGSYYWFGFRQCVLRSPFTILIRELICHLREQRLEPWHSCRWDVQMGRGMLKCQVQGYTAGSYSQSSSFSQSLLPCSWLCFLCLLPFQLLPHSLHHPSSLKWSTLPSITCSL